MDIAKLLDKISVENVNRQIEAGLSSSFFIAERIIGLDLWKSLSKEDRKILAHRVNRINIVNRVIKKSRPI